MIKTIFPFFYISSLHFISWLIIFLYEVFTLYALNIFTPEDLLLTFVSVFTNTCITYIYILVLYKTLFFSKIPYRYQAIAFSGIVIGLSFLIISVYIFIEKSFFDEKEYNSWISLGVDLIVLSASAGRFTLMCLLAHHAYFLGWQIWRDKEERNTMQLQLLALEQETIKLKLHPKFLTHIFSILENMILKDQKTARYLLTLLSDVLRNALSYDKSEQSTLAAEIEATKKYLDLATYGWEYPLKLVYDPKIELIGLSYFLPTGALLSLVNFILYKAESELILKIVESPHNLQIFLSFKLIMQNNLQEDFLQEASLQNLRKRLQQIWGVEAGLNYYEQNKQAYFLLSTHS